MNMHRNRRQRWSAMIIGAAVVLFAVRAVAADAAPAPSGTGKAAKDPEHMRLDTTIVKGHEGLPRVLYIVPWKRADTGDLQGRPPTSLVDEALAPIDRAEFRDHLRYYDGLHTDSADACGARNPTP
jgi:hypothetical protein